MIGAPGGINLSEAKIRSSTKIHVRGTYRSTHPSHPIIGYLQKTKTKNENGQKTQTRFSQYYKQSKMKFSILSFIALTGTVGAFAPSVGTSRPSTSSQLDATRKPFISGNWKLNPQTRDEALTLASEIAASINDDTPDADIALFVPYVFIESAMGSVDGKINVGAEVSSCC